jgi:hypothetical protein
MMNRAQMVFKAIDGLGYPTQNMQKFKDVISVRDIAYGDYPMNKLDFYYHKDILNDGKKHPVVMYIHGGGFIMGDKKCRVSISEYYADKGADSRRFAVLPFPKADASKVGRQTHYDSNQSAIFINSKIDAGKIDVAKEIVQYIFSNDMLSKYTASSSVLLPYDYEVSDEDYATMSNFGKSVYDMRDTTDYVYGPNQSSALLKNPTLTKSPAFWKTTGYDNPISAFYNNKDMTAKDYFEDITEYYNAIRWSEYIS